MPTQTTQPAKPPAADNPFEQFQWKPQPEAERLVRELVDGFLKRSPFTAMLRDRMYAEAGVRFHDLVEDVQLPESEIARDRIENAGFTSIAFSPGHDRTFGNQHGLFPTITTSLARRDASTKVTIKVESVADFVSVWQTADSQSFGSPLAPIRWVALDQTGDASLRIAEHHGNRSLKPERDAPAGVKVLHHGELFRVRSRLSGTEVARFEAADAVITGAIDDLGVDYACDLFFAAERDYWQRRNWAGAIQKARQDRLGIGWANHDHHTYRSSRKHFARLISIFEKLGFHCRERFYAGRQAGWGAQVLEQPNAGIVIFADVDLSPDELLIDFAHEPLPERQQLGTVGLWCALHGESFLEAGMHHLECQFDFEALRTQLEAEAGIRTMKPFTDFPYLRQAFTEGERWPVREERIRPLLELGQITPEQAEGFRTHGAIGSHLENLERNAGFKGFNQTGVSEIIAATDPRRHVRG